MASLGTLVSSSNSTVDIELFIFHSTIEQINTVSEKIVFVIYAIVLILSILQTFWKNKRMDRVLAYMNEAYSDGKFESSQVCFRQQIITCYRFDKRFSYIPHPNRAILFVISTHIQVLMLVAIRTLFTRRNELVNDCFSFHYPDKVLQCEDKRDPCRLNDTETDPKCTYYHFEQTNIITMVTSVITWHYALRYLIVKLIRFVQWILFRDDDRPRKWFCCCRITPCMLRGLMYLQYFSLWVYLFLTILLAFLWNRSLYRISIDLFGSVWAPIVIAGDRLFSLNMALVPEMLQNWLDATSNGKVLEVFESKELLLANTEPLVYLTNKKTKTSTSIENRASQNNAEVVDEATTHI
jgi:hypothetical protein